MFLMNVFNDLIRILGLLHKWVSMKPFYVLVWGGFCSEVLQWLRECFKTVLKQNKPHNPLIKKPFHSKLNFLIVTSIGCFTFTVLCVYGVEWLICGHYKFYIHLLKEETFVLTLNLNPNVEACHCSNSQLHIFQQL